MEYDTPLPGFIPWIMDGMDVPLKDSDPTTTLQPPFEVPDVGGAVSKAIEEAVPHFFSAVPAFT